MKQIAFALLTLIASNAFADAKFCRDVKTDGTFGQPAGVRQHCVELLESQSLLIDNGSTFFGNPPETLPYRIEGREILVERNGSWAQDYSIEGDTLVNGAGAVLVRQ